MVVKKITSSGNDVLGGKAIIKGFRLVPGDDSATAILYNHTAQSGDEIAKLMSEPVITNAGAFVDRQEGLNIDVRALSVTLVGTNEILYVYYD